jgi:two-component system sensor histidine kinase/response regulator
MIDLLLSTNLNDEQYEYAGHVRTSADALLEILNDILDLSKIEAGRLELEKRQFNLRELVEDAVDLHALKAHEKNVELACHIPPELAGSYRGDTGRLRQVLLNYISNAVKFTEKGTVRVTVASDQSGHIRFEVCDTGIGIAQELQLKIFEAFRQADGSTTRKYGGTGLGLAISRELVELMDGQLGVESELENGSTFWFSIPLEPVPEPPAEPHRELIGKSLLLAVPDGFVRRALVESASEWGLEINSVSDGSAVIRHLDNSVAPDMVLLDLDLPGVDVLDLVQLAHDHSPNVRVLLLTTRTRKFDPAIVRAMGISGTLAKPIKCRRLAMALVEALVGKKSTPAETSVAAVHRVPRVLVIEDNMINQRVAQLQLEKLGCQVFLRDRGEVVLEEKLDDYDMIFMDCQMPGMDGLEATRKIREMQKDQKEKSYIIAMTANAREADRQACLDAGMNDFISKPIEIEKLQHVVNHALDGIVVVETNAVGLALPVETLREILPLYLDQARKQVTAMEAAAGSSDNEAVRQAAHQLKGSSANVGAQAMADLCARVEEAAENGGAGLELLVPDLSRQLEIAEGLLGRQAGL